MIKTHLKHDQLIGITPNQHHNQVHDLSSREDHSGLLKEKFIKYPNPPLHKHLFKNRIRAKKQGEKDTSYHSTLEFVNAGGVTINLTNDTSNKRSLVSFELDCTTSGSATGSTGSGATKEMCFYRQVDQFDVGIGSPSGYNRSFHFAGTPLVGVCFNQSFGASNAGYRGAPFINRTERVADMMCIDAASGYNPARYVKLAIYENINDTYLYPGDLVEVTDPIACGISALPHTGNLLTPVTLQADSLYWFFQSTNNTINFRAHDGRYVLCPLGITSNYASSLKYIYMAGAYADFPPDPFPPPTTPGIGYGTADFMGIGVHYSS